MLKKNNNNRTKTTKSNKDVDRKSNTQTNKNNICIYTNIYIYILSTKNIFRKFKLEMLLGSYKERHALISGKITIKRTHVLIKLFIFSSDSHSQRLCWFNKKIVFIYMEHVIISIKFVYEDFPIPSSK